MSHRPHLGRSRRGMQFGDPNRLFTTATIAGALARFAIWLIREQLPDGSWQAEPILRLTDRASAKRSVLVWTLAHGIEVIESFLQAEVAQVVGAEFVAEEAEELLVLFEQSIFPVGTEHVMSVLDLVDHDGQFSAQAFVQPDAKDLANAVGR